MLKLIIHVTLSSYKIWIVDFDIKQIDFLYTYCFKHTYD